MIDLAMDYIGIGVSDRKVLIDYYNDNCIDLVKKSRRYRMKMGDNWCAMFVSVLAHMKNVDRFPYEVSCMEQIKLLKGVGAFSSSDKLVEAGDLIFFDWDKNGWSDHVGLVTFIDGEYVYTIEGNKGGTVSTRKINKNSETIYGYGLIKLL